MHIKRLAVAVILLPIFYIYVMKLPQVYFFILLLTASIIAQWEFYSMYRLSGIMRASGIFLGIALMVAMYVSENMMDILLLSIMVVSSLRLLSKRNPSSSLHDISPVILALLYIPGLLGFQLSLRGVGPEWIIFLYGCVWASDSLAYYAGKTLGKRRLYREVSPNKTIAGASGSVIGGVLSGWLLNLMFIHAVDSWKALLIGIIIGATTILGDLVESMFKRDAGVKDSGAIIPGHGGILDKIDGVLFAGPILYWVADLLDMIK
ncbi:MAG: phosphatidate cytidylyltransferase [Thermodesulfovibrionales bacterium]